MSSRYDPLVWGLTQLGQGLGARARRRRLEEEEELERQQFEEANRPTLEKRAGDLFVEQFKSGSEDPVETLINQGFIPQDMEAQNTGQQNIDRINAIMSMQNRPDRNAAFDMFANELQGELGTAQAENTIFGRFDNTMSQLKTMMENESGVTDPALDSMQEAFDMATSLEEQENILTRAENMLSDAQATYGRGVASVTTQEVTQKRRDAITRHEAELKAELEGTSTAKERLEVYQKNITNSITNAKDAEKTARSARDNFNKYIETTFTDPDNLINIDNIDQMKQTFWGEMGNGVSLRGRDVYIQYKYFGNNAESAFNYFYGDDAWNKISDEQKTIFETQLVEYDRAIAAPDSVRAWIRDEAKAKQEQKLAIETAVRNATQVIMADPAKVKRVFTNDRGIDYEALADLTGIPLQYLAQVPESELDRWFTEATVEYEKELLRESDEELTEEQITARVARHYPMTGQTSDLPPDEQTTEPEEKPKATFELAEKVKNGEIDGKDIKLPIPQFNVSFSFLDEAPATPDAQAQQVADLAIKSKSYQAVLDGKWAFTEMLSYIQERTGFSDSKMREVKTILENKIQQDRQQRGLSDVATPRKSITETQPGDPTFGQDALDWLFKPTDPASKKRIQDIINRAKQQSGGF